MTERDKYEQWASEIFDVPVEHLKACRWVDEDGVEGYDGLKEYGYTDEADDLLSMGWLSRKAILETPKED